MLLRFGLQSGQVRGDVGDWFSLNFLISPELMLPFLAVIVVTPIASTYLFLFVILWSTTVLNLCGSK